MTTPLPVAPDAYDRHNEEVTRRLIDDRLGVVEGIRSSFYQTGVGLIATVPVVFPSYTVATLPATATAGAGAYASDGRKNGEGAGLGTGVLVFGDGTAWRACDTGATVAA